MEGPGREPPPFRAEKGRQCDSYRRRRRHSAGEGRRRSVCCGKELIHNVFWSRKYYQSGGGNPYVGYVVFGDIKQPLKLSASKYRSAGVPQGVQISSYTAERHAETFRFFLESSFLKALTAEDPTPVKAVLAQKQCLELRGEVKDPSTLNYFRDALGLVTCLLDQGGVAVLDVQILKWWSPVEWHKQIFDHGQAYPRHHVVIQITPEEANKEWSTRVEFGSLGGLTSPFAA
jgi:hypothetical protein